LYDFTKWLHILQIYAVSITIRIVVCLLFCLCWSLIFIYNGQWITLRSNAWFTVWFLL